MARNYLMNPAVLFRNFQGGLGTEYGPELSHESCSAVQKLPRWTGEMLLPMLDSRTVIIQVLDVKNVKIDRIVRGFELTY
jgi:hypothetical protein